MAEQSASTWRERVDARIERLGGKVTFSMATLFASLFLGVLANKYTDQILPWNWRIGGDPLWGVWLFYVLGFLVVGGTTVAQRAQDRKRDREDQRRAHAERELIGHSNELQRLVETLPPTTFLSSFATTDNACRGVLVDLLYDRAHAVLPPERVREAIRAVLGGLAELIRIFENSPLQTTYAANVMIFRPAAALRKLPPEQRREWERGLAFSPPRTRLVELEGILQLVPELSTTTARAENEPDELKPLRLPVPEQRLRHVRHGDSRLWRVLPGAPVAWVRKKWVAYPSQADLFQWCRDEGAFADETLAALRSYFDAPPGSAVQGFASLPFPTGAGTSPVGVLNVHSDQPGLFAGRDPVRHLFPLLNPILQIVNDLVDLLVEAENGAKSENAGGTQDAGETDEPPT